MGLNKVIAPIALFVYNRINNLQHTVHSLKLNKLAKDSDLYIFSDGGKTAEDWQKVNFIREYYKNLNGFKSIMMIKSSTNLGVATSVIGGVNYVLTRHDRVIVLEDDLVTAPYFLKYMNDALCFYKDDENVISISGYVYPIKGLPETFFVKGADCLGWGTWKRGWGLFDYRSKYLLDTIKPKKREFNFNNSYPFYRMLKKRTKGKLDSWAILWYASAFLNGKYTLYPKQSLVKHVGNDSSATHRQRSNWLDTELSDRLFNISLPMGIERIGLERCTEKFSEFFRAKRPSLKNIILGKIKKEKPK